MRRPVKPQKPNWHPPLDPEDAALWEDVKKTVRRLQKTRTAEKSQPAKAPKLKLQAFRPDEKALPKTAAALKPASTFDRLTLRKIKSGKISIDDRLDLHGLNQEAAQRRLEAFILSAQQRELKLVLVITGKGDRFSKKEGILRQQLPRWLKETQMHRAILSFSKAAITHGGEGAFYVRLRKRR